MVKPKFEAVNNWRLLEDDNQIDQAACFRFLRQPSRPNTPMWVAKSGREAGMSTAAGVPLL
jgi:hypothetical protein